MGVGIKGTVRRNQDGHFIHANIDLDIIITEEVWKCGIIIIYYYFIIIIREYDSTL